MFVKERDCHYMGGTFHFSKESLDDSVGASRFPMLLAFHRHCTKSKVRSLWFDLSLSYLSFPMYSGIL